MKIGRPGLAHRHDENRAVGTELAVNDRGGRDANLRCYLTTAMVIGRYFVGAKQRNAPKDVGGVGVERIHSVVLGGDYQHIVVSLAWNRNTCRVKRLCVHLAISGENPQPAEVVGVEVGRLQNLLVQRLSRSRVIVVEGQHVRHLRPRARRNSQEGNQPWRQANCQDDDKLPSGGTCHGAMVSRATTGALWGIHPIFFTQRTSLSRSSHRPPPTASQLPHRLARAKKVCILSQIFPFVRRIIWSGTEIETDRRKRRQRYGQNRMV